MENPSPPPYSSTGHESPPQPGADDGNALLDHLINRANDRFHLDADYPAGAQDILSLETERIRSMLEFTLSVDYRLNGGACISAADREHFTHLAEAFRMLRRDPRADGIPRKTDPHPEGRAMLSAFFVKYLHEPCKALSLPIDSVYDCIIFLSRYTDRSGRYKGSLNGQLHDYGLEGLASKLYMDRTILIPRVFTDIAVRKRMIDRAKATEKDFFDRIVGIESSTVVRPGNRGFQVVHSVKYEANESAVEYASSRKTMLARICKDLSIQHWAKTVGEYVKRTVVKTQQGGARKRTLLVGQKQPEVDIVPGGWQALM